MTGLAPDAREVVVCDACVLINFAIVDRIDLLGRHPRFRFVISREALGEVARDDERARVERALGGGDVHLVELGENELPAFAELRAFLGEGEASCLAIAVSHAWLLATDEGGRARREVDARLGRGRLLTTPRILLDLVRGGELTVERADAIKSELERRRFKMAFASFRDLLEAR